MEEEIIFCRNDGRYYFCFARFNQHGRIMIGEQVDEDNIDMMFYDLSPTDLIALGVLMIEIGKEIVRDRRRMHYVMREDDSREVV